MSTAYLLVSHGSSDARHQSGLTRLAHLTQQAIADKLTASRKGWHDELHWEETCATEADRPLWAGRVGQSELPEWILGTATLEAAEAPLAMQIEAFGRQALARGIRQVVIVPLFLLAGVHVTEDVPAEIAIAQRSLQHQVSLWCTPHLGDAPGLFHLMRLRLTLTGAEKCLLFAHGSRRRAGNRAVMGLASALDAATAFWSVPPDLETRVLELIHDGYQHIAIAPYFLFPGGITDSILHRTEALADRFPRVRLRLLSPLGSSADLGSVVADLALGMGQRIDARDRAQTVLSLAEDGITA